MVMADLYSLSEQEDLDCHQDTKEKKVDQDSKGSKNQILIYVMTTDRGERTRKTLISLRGKK